MSIETFNITTLGKMTFSKTALSMPIYISDTQHYDTVSKMAFSITAFDRITISPKTGKIMILGTPAFNKLILSITK